MSVWDRLGRTPTATALARIVARGDLPHAWLFLGAAGSGKRTTAEVMAAAVNCRVSPLEGCGECSACLRILRRRHPDVHHIVPEGPIIPVDVVRESVVPEAARSPFEAPYKVFIIEEADRMNDPAQNALLKTLEEPHPDTIFFLLSDHEEELLETIFSRCRVMRLQPVPETRIIELLQEQGASQADALLAARLSGGDFERARGVAFDAATGERRQLWVSIPRRLVSSVDALDAADEILGVARAAVKEREKQQKAEVAALAEMMGEGRGTAGARNALAKRHKRELRRLEEEIIGEALLSVALFYRDVVAVRSGGGDAVTNLDLHSELAAWADAEGIRTAALLRAAERCIQVRGSLTRNANATLAVEAALAEATRLVAAPAHVASGW